MKEEKRNAGIGRVVARTGGIMLAEGSNPVHGRAVRLYRVKLYGILAAITFLHKVEYYRSLPLPPITLHYDNKAAIEKVTEIQKPTGKPSLLGSLVHSLTVDYNVLEEIAVTAKVWTAPISLQHIEAHQDTMNPNQELSVPAQLNICANHSATETIRLKQPTTTSTMFPNAGVVTSSKAETITRKQTSDTLVQHGGSSIIGMTPGKV